MLRAESRIKAPCTKLHIAGDLRPRSFACRRTVACIIELDPLLWLGSLTAVAVDLCAWLRVEHKVVQVTLHHVQRWSSIVRCMRVTD